MSLFRAVFAKTICSRVFWAAVSGISLVVLLFVDEHSRAGGGRFLVSDWVRQLLWLIPPLLLIQRLPPDETPDTRGEWRRHAPEVLLFALMVLFLLSGAVLHPWFYFLDWVPQNRPGFGTMDSGLVRTVLLTSLFLPFLLKRRPNVWFFVLLIFLFSEFACFRSLLKTTGGAALYRDDHPSFMFRLWEFAHTFPRLVTYNPYWNGGVVNFVGTSSGTAAVGLPLFPLWRFFPTHQVYTLGIGLIYIVLMPWIAVASVRILGGNRTAALCGGLLALGVSRHFFLWMLHFGTIGAAFSSSFVLPVCACTYRVVWRRKRETWLFVVLVLSICFLVQWPPGGLMALPLALSMLLSVRRWTVRTWGFLAAAGAVVLLLMLRPLLTVLLRGDALMSHVMEPSGQSAAFAMLPAWLARGFFHLVAHVHEGHPLLIFLGLAGLCVLPYRSLRRWCAPLIVLLAFLAGWGRDLKPNLQLGRMSIPMFFVAVIPASVLCARLLGTRRRGLAVFRSGLLALLLMGGWNVARLYRSEGHAPYTVLPPEVTALTKWIRGHVPPGGRVLFAGRCVHFYGRGHVAYLPVLSGREMMACDYYAFPPKTVEYNYPPRPFRRPENRLFEFMDLYNVTHVLTYHDEWKDAFRRHPDQFEEVQAVDWDRVAVFRVRREPSLFLKGRGEVKAGFNRLAVQLAEPADEIVLRYNWSDRLTVPAPVELRPWDAGDGIRLIAARPNGVASFDIEYRDWL